MHRSAPLLLSLVLVACSSDKPETEAKAEAEVAVDAKAGAAAAGDVKIDPAVLAAVAGAVVVELKPVAEVEAALGTKISLAAADLDLRGITTLIVSGQVKAAAELELLLNAPAGASHSVDLDADGKLDYVQVVELRAGTTVTFELRAVPSSKLDLSLAVLLGSVVIARAEAEGKLVISASYGAAVAGGADFEFSQDVAAELRGEVVTVADLSTGAFLAWTFTAGRPVHVSTHVSAAHIQLAANGAVHFAGGVAADFDAARLAGLRAGLEIEGAIGAPKIAVDGKAKAGAKAEAGVKAGAKASHSAKAESSAKVEGGGLKVGGSVKVGGSASIGGGGKSSGGFKIGK